MTAPVDSPETRGTTDDAPDEVRDELLEQLRDMASATITEPAFDWAGRIPDPRERDEKRAKVLSQVLANSAEILHATSDEVLALRGARKRLDDRGKRPRRGGEPNVLDRTGHAMAGVALWLGVIIPLGYWQLGRSLSGVVLLAAQLTVVFGALGVWQWSTRLIARAGVRFTGNRGPSGAGWSFLACLAAIYGLLLWRLWLPSSEAMGPVLAGLVWVLAALPTIFVISIVYSISNDLRDSAKESRGPGLPRAVVGRLFVSLVIGLCVTFAAVDAAARLALPRWAGFLAADAVSLLWFGVLGPLVLTGGGLVGRPWQDTRRTLRDEVDRAAGEWRKAASRRVRELATYHFTNMVETTFSTTFDDIDRRSLGQMHDSDRVVTSLVSGHRLRAMVAGLRGGAVGVAGPRGVGKSSLLNAYRQGAFNEGAKSHIAVSANVPVRYDAREFVLHLFARTSTAVEEFCTKRGAERDSLRWSVARRTVVRRGWPVVAVLVLWLGIGLLGSLVVRDVRLDPAAWFDAMWWPLIAVFGAVSVLFLIARKRPVPWRTHQEKPPQTPPGDLSALRDRAQWELDRIRYQQKQVAGWSGKVGQFGAEATATGSREVTRQPLSYPEIVHEFSEFLRATIGCLESYRDVERLSLVIILDELDKIVEPEAAQAFLNEIKSLFSLDVPGFLFLVSVSEDALAAFERRGLPVRDAFDSSFDMIFRVAYLKLGDSRKVLSRRVLGLPDPFVCLCHCVAGGLPRELIRVGRQVIAGPRALADSARHVVAEDLAGKQAALRAVAARDQHDEAGIGDLVRHVDAHAVADPEVLLDAVTHPPLGPVDQALWRLQAETLGYLYFLATVLEVFGPGFTETDWQSGAADGDGSFDTLASVRQLFPVNARLAWLTTNAFRRSWGLVEVAPPA